MCIEICKFSVNRDLIVPRCRRRRIRLVIHAGRLAGGGTRAGDGSEVVAGVNWRTVESYTACPEV